MPGPYPNVRYLPTSSARNAANSLGISLDSATYAVRNYDIKLQYQASREEERSMVV